VKVKSNKLSRFINNNKVILIIIEYGINNNRIFKYKKIRIMKKIMIVSLKIMVIITRIKWFF
jgi:hypothetical protein